MRCARRWPERLARQAAAGLRSSSRRPASAPASATRSSTPCWPRTGWRSANGTPRTLDDLEDDYFDLIVTLAPEAHHAALELTRSLAVEVEYWPTADPTATQGTREQIMAAYRDVRDRLKARIGERFGREALQKRR